METAVFRERSNNSTDSLYLNFFLLLAFRVTVTRCLTHSWSLSGFCKSEQKKVSVLNTPALSPSSGATSSSLGFCALHSIFYPISNIPSTLSLTFPLCHREKWIIYIWAACWWRRIMWEEQDTRAHLRAAPLQRPRQCRRSCSALRHSVLYGKQPLHPWLCHPGFRDSRTWARHQLLFPQSPGAKPPRETNQ